MTEYAAHANPRRWTSGACARATVATHRILNSDTFLTCMRWRCICVKILFLWGSIPVRLRRVRVTGCRARSSDKHTRNVELSGDNGGRSRMVPVAPTK